MADTSRSHVLTMPRPFVGLRVVQLVFAIIVLGMSAYGLNFADYDGFSLSLFTALATMILTVYIIVATLFVPMIYNYWAILALDIFGVIFWLSSFALMASEAHNFHIYRYRDFDFLFKRAIGLQKRDSTSPSTYKHVMIATSVFGAFEFLLFVATLILTVLHLLRHRRDGGHSMYNRNAGTRTGGHVGGTTTAPAASAAPVHDTEMPTYGGEMKTTTPPDALPVQHPAPVTHSAV